MPKVSVIIPTYNRASFVSEAIDSVLSQTFTDYEIIVIDDGSTDHTQEVLKRFGGRIAVIRQMNAGVGAARNAGINYARGEWVAFLDSDDVWQSEYLQRQMKQVDENPALCILMTNSIRIEADGSTIDTFLYGGIDIDGVFKNDSYVVLDRPLAFILPRHLPYLQATVFRRRAFMEAGLFNEKVTITEDLDAIVRMCLKGPLSLCRMPLVSIIRREESIKNLGSKWYSDEIYCRDCLGSIYDRLMLLDGLSHDERSIVNEVWSSNKKAIGNLHFKSGQVKEGRKCYREAAVAHPSMRSIMKVIISYFPRNVMLSCIGSSDRVLGR